MEVIEHNAIVQYANKSYFVHHHFKKETLMKITLRILMILAIGMCLFNLFQIHWEEPLSGKSSIAVIGTIASASAFLLLLILMLSRKIASKVKK
ncbi:MAG: hypothetical protein VW080_02950 [Flavobacteriaceae bacterium]